MKRLWWFVIVLVILLPIGWYLASPLFVDNMVSEENPNSNLSSIISQNTFFGADSFHQVNGDLVVLSSADVTYLRFENFESTNGPDLKVYLSNDLEAKDYVSFGDLKGNIGDQNYEIPENINLEDYKYVLIWCERFSVLFGHADLN